MEEEENITVLIIGKSFYDRTCALFEQKAFYISRLPIGISISISVKLVSLFPCIMARL